jgi:hypothetical protein
MRYVPGFSTREGEAMRRVLILFLVACGLASVWALPASADHIPPHQHFIVTPGGMLIPVGPDSCSFGPSTAFDNYHFNVHFGTPNLDAWRQPNNPVSFLAPVPCP